MIESLTRMEEELQGILFGQEAVVRELMVALLAGGHVVLQGVPGVGKTKLAKSLTQFIGGSYHRIQFTPDMMPSDVLGNAWFNLQSGTFEMKEGPIFANVILADEINRTPPKTQAALLEAMEERQVSIYGETRKLPEPFIVIATQNPIEYEGTYPLPEAQLDRFLMQINIDYPDKASEVRMLTHHQHKLGVSQESSIEPLLTPEQFVSAMQQVQRVTVAEPLLAYIVDIVRMSRQAHGVILGASPRAATALLDATRAVAYLANRSYAIPDDVLTIVQPVLRHRLLMNPNAELEGVTVHEAVSRIVEAVEVPR